MINPPPQTSHDFGEIKRFQVFSATKTIGGAFAQEPLPTVSSGLRKFSLFRTPHGHKHSCRQLSWLPSRLSGGVVGFSTLVLSLLAQRSHKEGCNRDKLCHVFFSELQCCLHLFIFKNKKSKEAKWFSVNHLHCECYLQPGPFGLSETTIDKC